MQLEDLPQEWIVCAISDVADVNPKKISADFSLSAGFVPMSHAPTDFKTRLMFEEKPWGEIQKAYTNFQNGDVIFAKVTPCFENGKAAIVDALPNGIGAGSSEFYVLRPNSAAVLNRTLFALIKTQTFAQNGAENMTGAVGLRRVPRAFVENFRFPLPPLAEQKVIADKLDILLAQVDNTKARLERIPEILKSFRQSVLAAAVSGKLTEEWREKHVFEVNSAEIARKHEKYFLDTKNKYQIPSGFNLNGASLALPSSWRWYRAEQLCDLITKGTTPAKENMSSNGEIPYIKVYNLTFDGSLDFSIEPTFVPSSIHNQDLKRSKVFPGDVLMNIVGPPLGKVSVVPDTYPEWNINQAICIFRPVCGVSNQYLSLCLRDEGLLELTKAKAKATAGQFNLTLEICRDYSLPIPPAEEQTEIVRRVEELFAYADRIEQAAQAAQSRVSNLTQSILAKAFRGELTAEWRAANLDLISGANSAESLLAKIKTERAKLSQTKKGRSKSVEN